LLKLIKKKRKRFSFFLGKKRQKRNAHFFFVKNILIEWKFPDFPSFYEITGDFPFFPGSFNFPANTRFSRSLDTLHAFPQEGLLDSEWSLSPG